MRPFRGKDLSGQKYGMLTVIKLNKVEKNSAGNFKYLWDCVCDCGNFRTIRVEQLVYSDFVSCGCTHKKRKKYFLPNFIDITGNKYARLTVKKYLGEGEGMWLCQCECGNFTKAQRNSLESGKKKSCGCYKKDLNNAPRKKNTYVFTNSYIIGYTENQEKFYIDTEDYDLIKDYYWHIKNSYVYTNKNDKRMAMHRLIMGIDKNNNNVIDHINHKNFDNRRINLRVCTDHQNTMNRIVAKNNKSGTTGVYKDKNKWRAVIFFKGKNIHLGSYENIEDAIIARLKAEKKYFKEFAPQQYMFEKYSL